MKTLIWAASLTLVILFTACETNNEMIETETMLPASQALLNKYTSVRLTTDMNALSERQRQMIPLLIESAQEMEAIFWKEAYGDKEALMSSLSDPGMRRFAEINYGPWDRLDGNNPFIDGVGPKPSGAQFYPADMTLEEFESARQDNPAMASLYTIVRRDTDGHLVAIPYHEIFEEHVLRASEKLRAAAELAEDEGLKRYLELRADALLDDEYQESDLAWMDMKTNTLDIVVGPIETYEDQLFGYKAAHESFVLVKDQEWSQRLARYAALLPMLQRGLPVPDPYKQETPGTNSDLGAYDAIYYAGDTNAGSKTIAINLPNDPEVQAEKGSRRLQLKNSMRAKFEEILIPVSNVLIAEDQRDHITFDAFFENTMFHEVSHGLGLNNTITGRGPVRQALRNHASAIEEAKADVLGLYMVAALNEAGELDVDLMDNYVTFLAGIFRAVRFGVSSAHGRANMIRFNFFKEMGAFEFDAANGVYRVNFEAMQEAINALGGRLLQLQGDGDYDAVDTFVSEYVLVDDSLQADLDRLSEAGIPVDIVFEQGMSVLNSN